jgi:hypothetical protein
VRSVAERPYKGKEFLLKQPMRSPEVRLSGQFCKSEIRSPAAQKYRARHFAYVRAARLRIQQADIDHYVLEIVVGRQTGAGAERPKRDRTFGCRFLRRRITGRGRNLDWRAIVTMRSRRHKGFCQLSQFGPHRQSLAQLIYVMIGRTFAAAARIRAEVVDVDRRLLNKTAHLIDG